MSNGLSNLGVALTIVFIISLFTLLAQLFYVLHRRRSLLCRIPTTTTTTNTNVQGFVGDNLSKDQLLYFFCMRTSNLSRVEPSNSSARSNTTNGSDQESEFEVIDMLKLQSMFGPSSGALCTIKEGEREGVESADEKSVEKEQKGHLVVVTEDEDEDDEFGSSVVHKTPFSTPCASPPFLTASGSLNEEDFRSLPL